MAYVVWKIFLKKSARINFVSNSHTEFTAPISSRRTCPTYIIQYTSNDVPINTTKSNKNKYENSRRDNSNKHTEKCKSNESVEATTHGLNEVVVNDSEIIDMDSMRVDNAPIARAEFETDDFSETSLDTFTSHCTTESTTSKSDLTSTVTLRRSESRVRTYLRKCKERLTGHQPANAPPSPPVTSEPIPPTSEIVFLPLELAVLEEGDEQQTSEQCASGEHLDCSILSEVLDKESVIAAATTAEEEDDDDAGSYEDIDFGLSAMPQTIVNVDANVDLLSEIVARQAELQCERQTLELQELKSNQMDCGLADLMDAYLAHIYPVYQQRTRAILIREARDLLVTKYEGSLQTFECRFLAKFAEIVEQLRMIHAIGESLVWPKGWPLATPTGEVILHLGALDETLVRSAEIYLCVKSVDTTSPPELHVVWRSATGSSSTSDNSDNCINSRRIDHSTTRIFSILQLEMMLSDDLPQLLQSLLVGVERAIERLSVSELSVTRTEQVTNNANNNNNSGSNTTPSSLASPKCALKRSELITKNKMLNNKFMLRRLTNRQDSMTSTSSGNSCSSTGSSSSDEVVHQQEQQQRQQQEQGAPAAATTMTASVSPALPLFCLGNTFPHIDSDEENTDEKRNSLECDTSLTQDIVAPRAIREIPDKLLTSGIYLPGTRDLKGRSIVTIDADCLLNSGLNCYEIATVLLYYSTIPESSNLSNNHIVCNGNNSTTTTTQQHVAGVVLQQPAQHTFTILIAIDKVNHVNVIDLICQSLKLLARHIVFCEILAVCLDRSTLLLLSKQHADAITTNTTSSTTTAATTTNWQYDKQQQQQQQQPSQHLVKFISVDEVTTSVAASQLPRAKLRGLHHHEPREWREFFALLEPFQSQCVASGQRLVTAMNELRCADVQGLPTRRQLYAQHRALSRALMDSELHNVRKRGAQTLTRLQELARRINSHGTNYSSSNNNNSGNHSSNSSSSNNNSRNIGNNNYSFSHNNRNSSTSSSLSSSFSSSSSSSSSAAATIANVASATAAAKTINRPNLLNTYNINGSNIAVSSSSSNIDVAIRLNKVTLLFNEVDRAAKRLEQLTEQRRERLRELTRQRALEDEINEVTSWITSDGNETLQRFSNLQLDCETAIKEHEQEFEKYYFISMKHLAKGRDLHEAAADMNALHESAANLKTALDCFAEKLELARERIEGATRLHQLMSAHIGTELTEDMQQEMQRLAIKFGVPGLLDKYRESRNVCDTKVAEHGNHRIKPNTLNLSVNHNASATKAVTMTTSTPIQKQQQQQQQQLQLPRIANTIKSNVSGIGSESATGSEGQPCRCWRESRHVADVDALLDREDDDDDDEEEEEERNTQEEEEQSKIADSGLGGCDRCEGNPKLSRICSCQSLNEAGNLYGKGHNSDELDDECFERPSKRFLNIHSPMEANAHLQCYAFNNMELPKMEELSCLEPKIQKTLLLIMREMIGTERDYVRSLYYVIENYVDELLRDDIPQPLRGQRNAIFGNIEKIFEFHNSHFLSELERYEHNPLKVGAAFLEMESKFYLYALYNKNKPKSDTLMSEYGTAFFKSKQVELADKMDLASYLLKPVQRMGKYALLLQQLVKACSTVEGSALQEIVTDVEELQRAEEMVKFQLRHGNDLLAMDSLRDCDVNVKEQGRLMRQNEFLVWQGRGGKKTLRQVFLFEELVLFSKARRFPDHKNLDIYIYKNSIKTSDIGLTAHVGDSPTKFEIWFRKRKPEDTWTLQCMSEDIKNAWTEEISKLLWKQAKRNRDIRLAEMSSMGIGSKPCLDIRPSNNQISDRSITITQLGKGAPKLRHSFVGIHAENCKTSKRPNSLISESSLSSGTSSSSTSTGSSSFSGGIGKHGTTHNAGNGNHNSNSHQQGGGGLELINETQALMLAKAADGNSGTLSSGTSSAASSKLRNHKRSTTLVSQLSMESGILSDISMTPDQEQLPNASATWSSSTAAVVMRKKCNYAHKHLESPCEKPTEQVLHGDADDLYMEERTTIVNL